VEQGNIPQDDTWDEAHAPRIVETYQRLARQAAALHPQLIIWPETSVPGYLGLDEELTAGVRALADEVNIPLLAGAPMGGFASGVFEMTNSAALVAPGDGIQTRYDKLHLVPFGEFIPLESVMPWLRAVLPPIGTFVAGRAPTVFWARGEPPPAGPSFGVLICFEDVFPELARRHVRAGARWLVTITNDAWFGPTAAAYQHAQASTFRAVELRAPMVRAANTGWSGCIDDTGRWVARVHDDRGRELFVPGVVRCELPLRRMASVYRLAGDWFVALCALLVVLGWRSRRPGVR
jgi:apolipoprotein N-acyltransferase